jgi:hypothetical protein
MSCILRSAEIAHLMRTPAVFADTPARSMTKSSRSLPPHDVPPLPTIANPRLPIAYGSALHRGPLALHCLEPSAIVCYGANAVLDRP